MVSIFAPAVFSGRVISSLRLLIAVFSLLGIAFLTWSYADQNSYVQHVFVGSSAQVDADSALTPQELVGLTHGVCLLDRSISNVVSFLQSMRVTLTTGGWCGNYARVFIGFANAEGYPAHKLHIQSGGRSHTLAEVYYEGKWRVVDPFFNQVYFRPDGQLATFEELAEDPSLVDSAWRRPLADPKLEGTYRRYVPIFPSLFADARDFEPSLDRSAFYHNWVVSLSYPISLLYEGGRRPISPAWVDRPELLGSYALSLLFLIVAAPTAVGRFRRFRHHRVDQNHRRSLHNI